MTDSLLARAQRDGTPLIDGDRATFVWTGVGDPPLLIGDFTGWTRAPLTLTEREPGVYAVEVTLPSDAFVEYCYVRRYRDPDDEDDKEIDERAADPFNPRVSWNGIKSVNHYASMPGFVHSPLLARGPGVARGRMSEHDLPVGYWMNGGLRKLFLYQPPTDQPVPLLVVWDGADYLERASLNVIVDNLIAAGRIRPIALALIDNAGDGRLAEYMTSEAAVWFALSTLLPYARKHLTLIDEKAVPGAHGAMGASLGGLMALWAGLRAPEVFGHVVSQSGSFGIDPERTMLVEQVARHVPVTAPLKVAMNVGRLEWLSQTNPAMRDLLIERGHTVTYSEYSGGHNYACWSHTVGALLEAVYAV